MARPQRRLRRLQPQWLQRAHWNLRSPAKSEDIQAMIVGNTTSEKIQQQAMAARYDNHANGWLYKSFARLNGGRRNPKGN
jgi:hypothetical protein